MIRWQLAPYLAKHGIENANQLAVFAGLTYPVATRVLAEKRLERIDVATLEKLAAAFGVSPFKLLEHSPAPR